MSVNLLLNGTVGCLFEGPYALNFFQIVSFTVNLIGSPLFLQFSLTGARGGADFWRLGLMAELWVGQALRCSSDLGLGSAVPAPIFLGTQPPYATQALKTDIFRC